MNSKQHLTEQTTSNKKLLGRKYLLAFSVLCLVALAGLTTWSLLKEDNTPDIIESSVVALVDVHDNQFTPEVVELTLGGVVTYKNSSNRVISIVVNTSNSSEESENLDKNQEQASDDAISIEPGGQLDISYQEAGEFGYAFADNTDIFGTVIVR